MTGPLLVHEYVEPETGELVRLFFNAVPVGIVCKCPDGSICGCGNGWLCKCKGVDALGNPGVGASCDCVNPELTHLPIPQGDKERIWQTLGLPTVVDPSGRRVLHPFAVAEARARRPPGPPATLRGFRSPIRAAMARLWRS